MSAMATGLKRGFKLTLPDKPLDDKSPLVVVLGWYGSQDRHVAKYSDLLNKQGYAAVRAILPNTAVFSPIDRPRRRFAAHLLDFLDSLSPTLGDRKIVFYVFSNGGGFALEQVDRLVQGSKAYRHFAGRIAATVFDSAPCYMHMRAGARAVAEGLSGPARLLAVFLFHVYLACLWIVAPNKPQLYWQSMQNLGIGSRSLYLYSDDDPLCDPQKLSELIAARRAAMGDKAVQAVRWERSRHVAHLRCHMRQYTEALFGFLGAVAAA